MVETARTATGDRERLREKLATCIQTGEITLSSGKVTDFYFDGRLVTLDAEGSVLVGKLMLDELLSRGIGAVGGLTSGADPITSSIGVLAWQRRVPMKLFFVRKDRKEHGTQKRIEGPALRGASGEDDVEVAIVDDVLTTGGSLLNAHEAIVAEASLVPKLALVIVDREEGGPEKLAQAGIEVVSLFKKSDFL